MSRSIPRFPLRHPIGLGDRVNTKENVLCMERKEEEFRRSQRLQKGEVRTQRAALALWAVTFLFPFPELFAAGRE